MLHFLIIMKPFTKRRDGFLNKFNELILSICCYSCLYMAYLERNEDFDGEKMLNAGWVIYYVNMILMILFTLVFIIDLLFTLKETVPKVISMIRKRIEMARERKRIAALTKRTSSSLKPGSKPKLSMNKKEHFNKIKKLVEGEELRMFE